MMQGRIKEIDFLKGVLIILMVLFHLTFVVDTYPYAKRMVYSFHMPAFLIISGYLANMGKSPKRFFRSVMWIAIPYLIMECLYIIGASYFSVKEHIEHLSVGIFLDRLLLHPLGVYWYLHTLILCSSFYYLIVYHMQILLSAKSYRGLIDYFQFVGRRKSCFADSNNMQKANPLDRVILCGMIFYAFSLWGIVSFSNAVYYMIGATIRKKGIAFCDFFKPSIIGVIPILLLGRSDELSSHTVEGYAMTFFVICGLLFFGKHGFARMFGLIGRNTLPILLFSPFFTLLSKSFMPYLLCIDHHGLLFALVAVVFTIAGCFGYAWVLDYSHLTQYLIGRDRLFVISAI